MSVRTLEELGQLLETSAAESGKTNLLLNEQVIPRLDRLEGIVGESGLNGHTELLKKFLDEYAAGQTRAQAWGVVGADLGRRLKFLAPSRRWIGYLLIGALGAIGWQLTDTFLTTGHLPGIR